MDRAPNTLRSPGGSKAVRRRRLVRAPFALALLLLVGVAAGQAGSPEARARADRENDFKALAGDIKVYDACYEKNFVGAECGRYQLKSTVNPEYWPYPDVPPIKWPEAPKQRDC